MQTKLSTAEVKVLQAISEETPLRKISRTYLERLYRLGLIEPSEFRVKLSLQGKHFLFGKK